jgi:hypothetical protein
MAAWRCLGCRTVYAVGIPACPQCQAAEHEEDGVAKASAEGGATHYVAEGDPVPDDLPAGVRMVGPGAPAPEAEDDPEPEEPDPTSTASGAGDPGASTSGPADTRQHPADAEGVPEPPPANAPKASWVDHAEAAGLPRDEAEAMTKAALVEAVRERDNGSP